jgi:hypothetical protein
MAVNLPVSAYLGVVIRIEPGPPRSPPDIAVILEHRDPALSLTLCRASDGSEMVAQWRSWGRALGVPLLVEEADGRLREPFERIGRLGIGIPIARRRRRTPVSSRRPSISLRGRRAAGTCLPRRYSEREIIARD